MVKTNCIQYCSTCYLTAAGYMYLVHNLKLFSLKSAVRVLFQSRLLIGNVQCFILLLFIILCLVVVDLYRGSSYFNELDVNLFCIHNLMFLWLVYMRKGCGYSMKLVHVVTDEVLLTSGVWTQSVKVRCVTFPL